MASAKTSAGASVSKLKAAVKQLSPTDLRTFKHWFAQWQYGVRPVEERQLIQKTKSRLPSLEGQRLKRLIAKSERGALTTKELEEYRTLAELAERINVSRVEALVELAGRWRKPVGHVMEVIGWESAEDETPSHLARTAKTGARARP